VKRALVACAAATLVFFLGGCAVNSISTYAEVKKQTTYSLQQIIDQMPQGTTASFRPEGKPYACSNRSLPGKSEVFLYTGEADLVLPVGTDVRTIVRDLPERLGKEAYASHSSQQKKHADETCSRT